MADPAVAMLRALSLRTRLTLLAAAGATAVLGITATLIYRDLSGNLSTAITDELTVRVNDLEYGLSRGTLPAHPALVTAQIVNADGTVASPRGADPLLTPDELDRAIRGRILVDRDVPGVGEHARLLARPLKTNGTARVVGVAATTTAPLAQARERMTLALEIAGPVLVAAFAAATWLLTGAALRPVQRMASEAETISAARIGRRLPQPAGNDEIAELGRTLNAMLDRIDATVARERSFIDNAAHELRTPVAVLRGELELATLETDDPAVVAANLRSALEEADRLTRITEDLLTLARADAGELVAGTASTDLLVAAGSAVRGLPHRPEVSIDIRGEPTLVRGDPEWIGQMIRNLVVNGERYAQSRVVVTATSAGGHGMLAVADDGPGFPPELIPRAFDRFARGEGLRSEGSGGAGIGLAIVASLVHALGGKVTATNGGPLGGACVEATLPLASSAGLTALPPQVSR